MKILLSNQFQWKLKALNVDPEKRETFPHTGGCPLTLQIGAKKSVRLKENFL